MKRLGWIAAGLVITFATTGCGGDGDHHTEVRPFVSNILSDVTVDGDIDLNGIITVGAGTVLAGVNPTTGNEFRGFFSFPLTSVPADADVQFASLELFVLDLNPLLTTPFTLDLVSFRPPLLSTDFSNSQLPLILTRDFDVFSTDPGGFVRIDVSPMVREAFRRGLADAQFRLLLDLNLSEGLVTIADPVASGATAPLLHVEYF